MSLHIIRWPGCERRWLQYNDTERQYVPKAASLSLDKSATRGEDEGRSAVSSPSCRVCDPGGPPNTSLEEERGCQARGKLSKVWRCRRTECLSIPSFSAAANGWAASGEKSPAYVRWSLPQSTGQLGDTMVWQTLSDVPHTRERRQK